MERHTPIRRRFRYPTTSRSCRRRRNHLHGDFIDKSRSEQPDPRHDPPARGKSNLASPGRRSLDDELRALPGSHGFLAVSSRALAPRASAGISHVRGESRSHEIGVDGSHRIAASSQDPKTPWVSSQRVCSTTTHKTGGSPNRSYFGGGPSVTWTISAGRIHLKNESRTSGAVIPR